MPVAILIVDVIQNRLSRKTNKESKMNIQEIRLKLTQQALDHKVPPEIIPRIIEPLAQYILKGSYLKDSPPKHP